MSSDNEDGGGFVVPSIVTSIGLTVGAVGMDLDLVRLADIWPFLQMNLFALLFFGDSFRALEGNCVKISVVFEA